MQVVAFSLLFPRWFELIRFPEAGGTPLAQKYQKDKSVKVKLLLSMLLHKCNGMPQFSHWTFWCRSIRG